MLDLPPAPEIDGARHLHSGKVRDLYELTGGPYAGWLAGDGCTTAFLRSPA